MSEWRQVELGQIADVRVSNVDKKTVPGELPVQLCNYMDVYSNAYIRGHLDFMQASATVTEIARFKVELGDVLITKDSETPDDIGIPSVVTNEIDNLICGYHVALIKPNKSVVDSVYLSKQLGRAETAGYFGRYAAGSTRYGLPMGAMNRTPIALPPLAHQQKIASILSTIDTAIEQTEALIEKYQHLKAGLMHDLFTRGVLPTGQLRPPREQAPELYQETAIGWIPKEWEVSGLATKGRAATNWIRTGPFGSSLKGEHWRVDGHPVITIGALGIGEFIESELLFVSPKDASRLIDFQLKENDVVFSRVADVGRSVVVREAQAGWIMSSNLMRIAVNETLLRPDYLQMQLASDSRVKAQIRASVNSGGRDVANSEVLNRLRFAIPTPAEQDRIIARAKGLAQRMNSEARKVAKQQTEKLGLMQDLLTGKVAVKPDVEAQEAVA